jgi:hypothetical protein
MVTAATKAAATVPASIRGGRQCQSNSDYYRNQDSLHTLQQLMFWQYHSPAAAHCKRKT